jgi:hypothetical protein
MAWPVGEARSHAQSLDLADAPIADSTNRTTLRRCSPLVQQHCGLALSHGSLHLVDLLNQVELLQVVSKSTPNQNADRALLNQVAAQQQLRNGLVLAQDHQVARRERGKVVSQQVDGGRSRLDWAVGGQPASRDSGKQASVIRENQHY